jgi:diketogulonate reductase-like aldo/keto reductase
MSRSAKSRQGFEIPIMGQGTWRMGEDPARRADEVAALELGIDLGMTLIDTAEMYAGGGAEEVTGEAIAGRRDEIFLVSKVLPENASRQGTIAAAEASLKRLGTDRIDLYLLHWPGRFPLEETYEAFERLVEPGQIGDYGVSNFDIDEMESSEMLPGGKRVAANQVLYNLHRRGIERRLLPWCLERDIVVMAYSPLEQARVSRAGLDDIAARHDCTPYQVALAWTVREPGVVAIPKSSRVENVRENAGAAEMRLTEEDLAQIDLIFPVPARDVPLETL